MTTTTLPEWDALPVRLRRSLQLMMAGLEEAAMVGLGMHDDGESYGAEALQVFLDDVARGCPWAEAYELRGGVAGETVRDVLRSNWRDS